MISFDKYYKLGIWSNLKFNIIEYMEINVENLNKNKEHKMYL
jgi:hypothetical protein